MSDVVHTASLPLISSDRVEGTYVYDRDGNQIGTIQKLMIEKIGGKVAYAIMSFGGFLGMGSDEHAIPWAKLTFDMKLGGYRTCITERQLHDAPSFYQSADAAWPDRRRETELNSYWDVAPYW